MNKKPRWTGTLSVGVIAILHLFTTTVTGLGTNVFQAQAIIKGNAVLPCDIIPPKNDTVVLVVWYKHENPIYSYDTRNRRPDEAKHWRDAEFISQRGFFRAVTTPATLSIKNVTEKDEGEYRCRIDYMNSPTRNSWVYLTIIVPPQKPTIFDDNGKEVPSVAGPYVEGGDMKLTCMVSGGKPPPQVRWWRNGSVIDSTDETTSFQNVRSNVLTVQELSRDDQRSQFTCEATNNNKSVPVSSTITIEMHLKPSSVEILSSNQPFSADRMYELPCQSIGSRPPAVITWWIDGKQLYNYTQKNSPDGNVTTSTLFFTPTRHDNDKLLTCRAQNVKVKNGVEEHTIKMNVFFVPKLRLELGSNLNPDDIEEGDDVYFECKIHANPQAYKVLWKHNNQILQPNPKTPKKIIISNRDLALQNVNRKQAGNYTCVASNVEGDGESNVVTLKVMFKPICRNEQKHIYGVARHEDAQILCEVESYPPPDSFKWAFNNTAETVDVPQVRYKSTSVLSVSTLSYTPTTENDYGSVLCWANNLAGGQIDPCVFHIIPAGKPDPPYNCSIVNETIHSLEVQCLEGFDGGQPQHFVLEVFDELNTLQTNVTSNTSRFIVFGLAEGKNLKIVVYSANLKGVSEQVILDGYTLKLAEKHIDVQEDDHPVLTLALGAIFLFAVLTIIIVILLKWHHYQTNYPNSSIHGFSISSKQKLPMTLSLRSSSDELKDDRNPDVIPANKDSEYQINQTILGAAQKVNVDPGGVTRSKSSASGGQNLILPNIPLSPQALESTIPIGFHNTSNHRNRSTISQTKSSDSIRSIEPNIVASQQLLDNTTRQDVYSLIDSNSTLTRRLPISSSTSGYYYREVVTVKTPLMGCDQESCV